jgi:hypothetical protein
MERPAASRADLRLLVLGPTGCDCPLFYRSVARGSDEFPKSFPNSDLSFATAGNKDSLSHRSRSFLVFSASTSAPRKRTQSCASPCERAPSTSATPGKLVSRPAARAASHRTAPRASARTCTSSSALWRTLLNRFSGMRPQKGESVVRFNSWRLFGSTSVAIIWRREASAQSCSRRHPSASFGRLCSGFSRRQGHLALSWVEVVYSSSGDGSHS